MKFKVKALFFICILYFSPAAFAAEKVYFYHTDPAGTPLAMTDSNGSVVWRADYKPFGEENTVASNVDNYKEFVGKEKDDESGLYYFGARYMNPKIGRFTAVDPVGAVDERTSRTNEELLLNPQRLNPYAYSLNNPYTFIDPDGRDSYRINREVGGNRARSIYNPFSHTYIAITDSDGKVTHTYSWGNDYSILKGWHDDADNDKRAAYEAIDRGKALKIGDSELDPYITKAYKQFKKEPKKEWELGDNCKHEAYKLENEAKRQLNDVKWEKKYTNE